MRHRAGGQHQIVIGQHTAIHGNLSPCGINCIDSSTQTQINAMLAIKTMRPQVQPLQRHVAHQICFGQRRALVWGVRLGSDQGDIAIKPAIAQLDHAGGSRLPGPDHDDMAHCISPLIHWPRLLAKPISGIRPNTTT